MSILINSGETVGNKIYYGRIEGIKTEAESGASLEGALFGLFREDETNFGFSNALMLAAVSAFFAAAAGKCCRRRRAG